MVSLFDLATKEIGV